MQKVLYWLFIVTNLYMLIELPFQSSFPSQYWFAIGIEQYLALDDSTPYIRSLSTYLIAVISCQAD